MREIILSEIRRLAEDNDGQPPGWARFRAATGFAESEWRGKFWSRWGDALKDAGYEPNSFTSAIPEDELLRSFARATRHYKKTPTNSELQIFLRGKDGEPSVKTILSRFRNKAALVERLHRFCSVNVEFEDLLEFIEIDASPSKAVVQGSKEGWVYLLKSGNHYKIGRSDDLERRIKQVSIALPEKTDLFHAIRTDDPVGIEEYWHKRFADQRANGEWFKLTAKDIAAFKRRKFQ